MDNKVDKLLKKSRKGVIALGELGGELEKFSSEDLEDFIEAMQGESIILRNKVEKAVADLEKAKERESKLSPTRQKIINELDKIPSEPDTQGPSGALAARGYHYHPNDYTLSEKDYKVLERYNDIEDKLKRSNERVDYLGRHQEYFSNVIKLAETIKTGDHSYLNNIRKAEAELQEIVKNFCSNIFGPPR